MRRLLERPGWLCGALTVGHYLLTLSVLLAAFMLAAAEFDGASIGHSVHAALSSALNLLRMPLASAHGSSAAARPPVVQHFVLLANSAVWGVGAGLAITAIRAFVNRGREQGAAS